MTELYRVDDRQPQNLYRGDRYIGVMFDPADTKMIAELLNRYMAVISTPVRTISLEPDELAKFLEAMPYPEPAEPETFQDGQGDVWRWDPAAGGYNLNGGGMNRWTIAEIKAEFGTWSEDAD